jgi:hypothetical protein
MSTARRRIGSSRPAPSPRAWLVAEFFTTPTSIMVGFGEISDQRVHLLRVEPSAPNLGHLAQVSDIIRHVVDGTVTPAEGLRQLHALKEQAPRWPMWLVCWPFVLRPRPSRASSHVTPGTS